MRPLSVLATVSSFVLHIQKTLYEAGQTHVAFLRHAGISDCMLVVLTQKVFDKSHAALIAAAAMMSMTAVYPAGLLPHVDTTADLGAEQSMLCCTRSGGL